MIGDFREGFTEITPELDLEGFVHLILIISLFYARLLGVGYRMSSIFTQTGKWGSMGSRAGSLVIETVKTNK